MYALVESVAASAGYYIGAAADKVFASSIFSEVGSIGIVSTAYDDREMLEKAGLKEITLYSNYSPLKNKVQRDVLDGHPDEFVKRFLDPMALQFIDDVKSSRPSLTEEAQQASSITVPTHLRPGSSTGRIPSTRSWNCSGLRQDRKKQVHP